MLRPTLPIVLAAACASPDATSGADPDRLARFVLGGGPSLPEVPAHARNTSLMHADAGGAMRFDLPLYPSLRTSADGRLGMNLRTRDGAYELYLLGPEGETAPLGASEPGVGMIQDRHEIGPQSLFDRVADEGANHGFLCDPTSQFPAPGEATNPYPCDADPLQDCYDLTVVIDVVAACNASGCDGPGESFDTKLWGTPITVAVDQPKTASATIASVTLGAPAAGPRHEVRGFFEAAVSGDGRLVVARDDWTRIPVPDPLDPTRTVLRSINMVYLLSDDPASFAPCDVAQWTTVQPLSHLHHDPAASGYGLARYPFRDSEGNEIGDYETLGVSYPWIDRAASNLFFTSVRSTLFYDADPDPAVDRVRARYPWRCLPGVACGSPATDAEIEAYEDLTVTRGVGFAGLWSHGKMVVLDHAMNHTDFGLGRDLDDHRRLGLYAPGTGPDPSATGWIRVGTGRDNGGVAPLGTSHNTAVIDSFENRFFAAEVMVPTTARDVVWTLNTGHGSVEVPFDDYLDPHALLVVEMGASITQVPGVYGRDSLVYNDGFVRSPPAGPPGFRAPVHFQNASTALDAVWQVPTAGFGFGGVRLEPVALGGIVGKGVWLTGEDDGIVFVVPEQAVYDVGSTDWYTGVFVDPRSTDDGVLRSLIGWPDRSEVLLRGLGSVVVRDRSGAEVAEVALPDDGLLPQAWAHLGFSLTLGGTSLEVLVDGFRWEVVTLPEPMLLPIEGPLVLGDIPNDHDPGFRGWSDELKVFAYTPGPEVACNHARGTLVEVGKAADEAWRALADRYPPKSHDAIAAALGVPAGARYACLHDYATPIGVAANVAPLPAGVVSIRDALLLPAAPLRSGEPRPDGSETAFCHTCHAADQPPGLSLDALAFDRSHAMDDDPRRQPMQPPRLVFGNVPADYVGPGLPEASTLAPPEGLALDPLTTP